PTGFMAEETFLAVLDEVTAHNTPLRFIRWGEPLLHPHVERYLRLTVERGLLAHVTTNGSLLSDDLAARLCDMGLPSIKFSFQGVDRESYAAMRNKDFFDRLLDRVQALHRIRGDRELPYIHASTTITDESPERVARFRERIRTCTDSHQVGRTVLEHIDPRQVRLSENGKRRLRDLKDRQSVVRAHAQCHQVFDVLSVNWDGAVSACCRDFDDLMLVGHMAHGGLSAAWNGPRLAGYRKILAEMGHDKLPLCRTCYDLNQLRLPNVQRIEPEEESACIAE
ncbi:MAG TPA: radical SAM protein, partial [Holophaga sp.]|nr:radical SAM protein [Holophaga sp.]